MHMVEEDFTTTIKAGHICIQGEHRLAGTCADGDEFPQLSYDFIGTESNLIKPCGNGKQMQAITDTGGISADDPNGCIPMAAMSTAGKHITQRKINPWIYMNQV